MTTQTTPPKSSLPPGWKETTLGKLAIKTCSGGTPNTQNEEYYGGTIPWLRTQEVNFNYIYDTDIKITDAGLNNSSATWIPSKSVIVAMYGNSAGRVAFTKIKTTTNQACFNFIADDKKSNSLFVFYNLMWRYHEIEKLANGGAQQNLNGNILKDLKIIIPDVSEQQAIAEVLSSLDDKIELLRKQNKTLESLAQTIFKECFVKFNFSGPRGKMVDSELGKIPEEWKVGVFSDIANVSTGKGIPKHKLNNNGKYNVIGANGTIGKTDSFIINSNIIITGRVGTLGTVFISRGKVWISDNVIVSEPKEDIYFYYVYFIMKRFNFESLNRGSTQPLITQTDIKNIITIIPDSQIMQNWNAICSSNFNKINLNNDAINSLSALRDALLPKLMSGKIRVKI